MSNRLPVLKAELLALHQDIERHSNAAAEKALAAGAALVEAKALVAHGGWAECLRDIGIPERTAARYMRLHRTGFKSATVADLGFAELDRMAALSAKLWPGPEGGRRIEGGDATHRFLAVTRAIDDSTALYACMTGPRGYEGSGGHLFCWAKPLDRVWMAKIHAGEVGNLPVSGSDAITADEAEQLFDAIQVDIIRHSWGTRLEMRGGAN
jgi:hypothetical protein